MSNRVISFEVLGRSIQFDKLTEENENKCKLPELKEKETITPQAFEGDSEYKSLLVLFVHCYYNTVIIQYITLDGCSFALWRNLILAFKTRYDNYFIGPICFTDSL